MMHTAIPQAAAEYVGVAISGAMRSVGDGLESAARYLENHPAALAAAVIAFLIVLRLLGRRRRR